MALCAETASGAEIPFELVDAAAGPRGRVPLYCYRPLTGAFIDERVRMLSGLPTYAPAVRTLCGLEGLDAYLRQRGESRIPSEHRDLADAALRTFLSVVYADRGDFEFDEERFEQAYDELELSLYEGRAMTTVVAPLLGIALDDDTTEVALGDGLALVRGDTLEDAPSDAVWGDADDPHVLIVLTVAQDRAAPAPVSVARVRFRRTLTALRLFEPGGFALGPVAWTRIDAGTWRSTPLGGSGRPRLVTRIPAEQEDELRAFCNLVARRTPRGGEIAWALSRFEMGCERLAPFEAADRLPAGAAGAARARRPVERTPGRPPRRDLRQTRGPRDGGRADRARDLARARGDHRDRPRPDRRRCARARSSRRCSARCSGTSCVATSTPTCAQWRTSCWRRRRGFWASLRSASLGPFRRASVPGGRDHSRTRLPRRSRQRPARHPCLAFRACRATSDGRRRRRPHTPARLRNQTAPYSVR